MPQCREQTRPRQGRGDPHLGRGSSRSIRTCSANQRSTFPGSRLVSTIRDPTRAEPRAVGVEPDGDDLEETERAQEELRSFIAEIVGSSPRWLRPSRAFVVQADGSQISSIASNPLTKAIHPNRTLG